MKPGPERTLLVEMVLAGVKPGAIAAHFGVVSETVRLWRNDPAVKAEVERLRDEAVGEARGRLKALAGRVPDALNKALDLALEAEDPMAIKAVCDTIADRVGLAKTTRTEATIEHRVEVSVDELRAMLRRRAEAITVAPAEALPPITDIMTTPRSASDAEIPAKLLDRPLDGRD